MVIFQRGRTTPDVIFSGATTRSENILHVAAIHCLAPSQINSRDGMMQEKNYVVVEILSPRQMQLVHPSAE